MRSYQPYQHSIRSYTQSCFIVQVPTLRMASAIHIQKQKITSTDQSIQSTAAVALWASIENSSKRNGYLSDMLLLEGGICGQR